MDEDFRPFPLPHPIIVAVTILFVACGIISVGIVLAPPSAPLVGKLRNCIEETHSPAAYLDPR